MGWISIVFAHKVLGLVSEEPSVRERLLRIVGVKPGAPVDPGQMLEDSTFFSLLEQVAHNDVRGRDVAVRLGASMRCDDYGAFGLAFKSAVDLASSYQRVERFGRVVTSIANFRVVAGERTSLVQVIPGPDPRLGLQMTHELALAAATALSREVSQAPFVPVAVHIAHAEPEDRSAFDEHFGCPVHFSAEHDALEVSEEALRTPNRLGDASFSQFFDAHLDQALATLPEDDGLARRIRAEIAQALSEGVPTLSQMAKRLGVGARTLQRRLAGAGLAYQALLEEARRELAGRLLRSSDYSLAEVAFLTGFSEQSTFSRAFKRWTGETPRAYRLAHDR